MSKQVTSLFCLALLLFSPLSWGWNTYGHLLFADAAFSKLTPSKQRELDQLAYKLVRQMDSQKRLYLMRTFEDTSAFAQASVFPDDWRGTKLSELFDAYGDGIPESLARYSESTTDGWHYINQSYYPFGEALQCEIGDENVVSVLPDLLEAYRNSSSENNRAILLAFILHFIADVHNPLHTMTKVNEECESDLGGNRFCVAYHAGGRSCEENLHQAWDRGLGFFDEHEKIATALEFIGRVEVDDSDAQELDPEVWASEGFEMARVVYSSSEGSELDPYYIEEGKIISYEQIALGSARLAAILNEL